VDNLSKDERSKIMSLVKSRNTKPELLVRKFLHSKGLRFRLHRKNLPGKPDIVLNKFKTVVFVHGCFWHGHNSKKCKLARTPKSNVEFWQNKVAYNRKRDTKNIQLLKKTGWNVIVIYECQIKSKPSLVLDTIVEKIRQS
jgi:DNA mismatch endonuclease, patch repair protein